MRYVDDSTAAASVSLPISLSLSHCHHVPRIHSMDVLDSCPAYHHTKGKKKAPHHTYILPFCPPCSKPKGNANTMLSVTPAHTQSHPGPYKATENALPITTPPPRTIHFICKSVFCMWVSDTPPSIYAPPRSNNVGVTGWSASGRQAGQGRQQQQQQQQQDAAAVAQSCNVPLCARLQSCVMFVAVEIVHICCRYRFPRSFSFLFVCFGLGLIFLRVFCGLSFILPRARTAESKGTLW